MTDLIDPHYEPEEPQDEDLEAVLSTVAAEGEGAILVQISKIDKGRAAWIFNAHPVDMPNLMERIRDEYGSGDYEAVIRRGNRIARRKRFSIVVASKPKEEPRQSNEMQVILQGMNALADGLGKLGQLIAETRNQSPATPQQTPMAMMTEMIGLMSAMQSMMPKPVQVDPMAQFKQTMELAQLFAENMSGEKPDPSPGQVLSDLAKQFTPVITAALNRPTIAPTSQAKRPVVTGAAPAPLAAPAAAQPKGNDPDMMMKMMMQRPVAQLLQLAVGGATAAECAIPVLEQVPDAYLNKFEEFISKPDAIEQLISVNPNVSNHREWFAALIAEMRAQLTSDSDPATVPGSETGIETHAEPYYFTTDGNT